MTRKRDRLEEVVVKLREADEAGRARNGARRCCEVTRRFVDVVSSLAH